MRRAVVFKLTARYQVPEVFYVRFRHLRAPPPLLMLKTLVKSHISHSCLPIFSTQSDYIPVSVFPSPILLLPLLPLWIAPSMPSVYAAPLHF